jgi:dihydroxyacid dehydratase/phosphogluconate dehydratase
MDHNVPTQGGIGAADELSRRQMELLADSVAMVTDGRFSGAAQGLMVGHVAPEASTSNRA